MPSFSQQGYHGNTVLLFLWIKSCFISTSIHLVFCHLISLKFCLEGRYSLTTKLQAWMLVESYTYDCCCCLGVPYSMWNLWNLNICEPFGLLCTSCAATNHIVKQSHMPVHVCTGHMNGNSVCEMVSFPGRSGPDSKTFHEALVGINLVDYEDFSNFVPSRKEVIWG
jgi:hypothetical protein